MNYSLLVTKAMTSLLPLSHIKIMGGPDLTHPGPYSPPPTPEVGYSKSTDVYYWHKLCNEMCVYKMTWEYFHDKSLLSFPKHHQSLFIAEIWLTRLKDRNFCTKSRNIALRFRSPSVHYCFQNKKRKCMDPNKCALPGHS